MRHKVGHRKLQRPTAHRNAMLRNMAASLIKHEQITTTLEEVEITKEQLSELHAHLDEQGIAIVSADGKPVTSESGRAEAAAAERQSPSTTAIWSYGRSFTRKPSTRQIASGHATRISAARSAARFVLCNPRESIPRTQRVTTHAFAAARITSG